MQTPWVTDRPTTAVPQALPLTLPSTAANKTRSYGLCFAANHALLGFKNLSLTRPASTAVSEAPARRVCTVPVCASQRGSRANNGTGAVMLALLTARSRPVAALSGACPCGQPAHKPAGLSEDLALLAGTLVPVGGVLSRACRRERRVHALI